MRTLVELPSFTKQAQSIWSEAEYEAFTFWLARNPEAGEVVPGLRGGRKVRWASSGRGKRGGARAVYYHLVNESQILLVLRMPNLTARMFWRRKSKNCLDKGAVMNQKPITSLKDFADIDVEAMARALEEDEGEPIPGIREALEEAKRGEIGRITTPEQMLLREARRKTGLTQRAFAKAIDTPISTIRDWEQGRFSPPGGVKCLLRLLLKHPALAGELTA